MKKYNLEKLVKIECADSYPSGWYFYKKEIKFLGFTVRKEGIYNALMDYVGLNALKFHTFKDGIVWEKPEVVLHYESNHSKTYYFETYVEAKSFADKITEESKKWIE